MIKQTLHYKQEELLNKEVAGYDEEQYQTKRGLK